MNFNMMVFNICFIVVLWMGQSHPTLGLSPRAGEQMARTSGGRVSAYKKGQIPMDLENTDDKLKLEADKLKLDFEKKRTAESKRNAAENSRLWEEGEKLQLKMQRDASDEYKATMKQMSGGGNPLKGGHVVDEKRRNGADDLARARSTQIFKRLMERKRLHGSVYLAKARAAAATTTTDAAKKEVKKKK